MSEHIVALHLEEKVLEVRVGVGVAIGEIDFVVVMCEIVLPRESEIGLVLITALAIAIFVILNILSASVPAQILLLRLLF